MRAMDEMKTDIEELYAIITDLNTQLKDRDSRSSDTDEEIARLRAALARIRDDEPTVEEKRHAPGHRSVFQYIADRALR